MEVKIRKEPRPKLECTRCRKKFPSYLDLQEHKERDHT
jgi:hypothetical protein